MDRVECQTMLQFTTMDYKSDLNMFCSPDEGNFINCFFSPCCRTRLKEQIFDMLHDVHMSVNGTVISSCDLIFDNVPKHLDVMYFISNDILLIVFC